MPRQCGGRVQVCFERVAVDKQMIEHFFLIPIDAVFQQTEILLCTVTLLGN